MPFVKYPSLINHYKTDEIVFSDDTECVVQEKLDGANIQFVFEPNKPFRTASRNQLCSDDFFGVNQVVERDFVDVFNNIQFFVDSNNCFLNLYGELIGPKIQKRINYGPQKEIVFFDVFDGFDFMSFETFNVFADMFGIDMHNRPVVLAICDYEKAKNIDNVFQSRFYQTDKENIAEGVVIKPYSQIVKNEFGNICMVKSKNDKFTEVARQKHNKQIWSDTVKQYNESFKDYINENRMLSYFSKAGPIESEQQIGQYIKEILADARMDFYNDKSEDELVQMNELDQKEIKKIFNVGGMVANLLINYLKQAA